MHDVVHGLCHETNSMLLCQEVHSPLYKALVAASGNAYGPHLQIGLEVDERCWKGVAVHWMCHELPTSAAHRVKPSWMSDHW